MSQTNDTLRNNKLSNMRAPLNVVPDDNLDALEWATTSAPCRFMINQVISRIRRHGDAATFEALNQRLFNGTISTYDSFYLWTIYVKTCIALVSRFIASFRSTFGGAPLALQVVIWLCEGKYHLHT